MFIRYEHFTVDHPSISVCDITAGTITERNSRKLSNRGFVILVFSIRLHPDFIGTTADEKVWLDSPLLTAEQWLQGPARRSDLWM